jgi:hypothetical protein
MRTWFWSLVLKKKQKGITVFEKGYFFFKNPQALTVIKKINKT